jgi:hypothetical protein
VAEVAVECGLTLRQAREYSPAQLKLLRAASHRLNAENVLMQMNATYAAFAAVMAKNGHKAFERLTKQLIKSAES